MLTCNWGIAASKKYKWIPRLFFSNKAVRFLKTARIRQPLSKLYRNIGALYGQRYQKDSQQVYLDRAIRIRRLLPDKTLLIEALLLKASTNLRLGRIIGGPGAGSGSENEYKCSAPRTMKTKMICAIYKPCILFQKGEFDQASVLFDSARNYFLQKSLFRKYVTSLIDLSQVFTERGDYELALNNLYDALRLSQIHHFDAESSLYVLRWAG
jgi:tetratricopeptide (TPR) repeat protein